jgi:hypothetical protein
MSITNNAGTITRDIEVTLDAATDYKPEKSPWVLVCNYIHRAGDPTGVHIRTFTDNPPILPEDQTIVDFKNVIIGSVTQNGSALDSGSWGHTGNELFNVICNALSGGVAQGADYATNGLELRFLAKSSGHTRVIHFKSIGSSYDGFVEKFKGNTITALTSLTSGTHYELYDGTNNTYGLLAEQTHSANLPGSTNSVYSSSSDTSMTTFPFHKNSTHHWGIGAGTRWEVDDNHTTHNTYHQIWVRANNLNLFGGSASVQSASILRTILDTVTFDPTGIAFTGSVVADENNTTNYYTLATTDPNLSRLQVVDLIENSPTSVASVGSNISANSNVVTDSILTQIVDVNSNVYSATAVNKAYVYTYAIDESGSNNHRDIDMKDVGGTDPVYAFALERDKIFPDVKLDPVTTVANNYIVSDIFTMASGTGSTNVGGFYIDLIPENVGDVYDFEFYWEIPYGNTTLVHGGFSLTSTGEPTVAIEDNRRNSDPGYFIDFYENTPHTTPNSVRSVTIDQLGIGYQLLTGHFHGGSGINPPDGRPHKNRYFRATLVSGNPSTGFDVDIQLELFEDEARTELAWKINKWSTGTDYDTLTATQVYFNFWIQRNNGYVVGQNHYFGNIIKNGINVLSPVPYVKYDTIVQPTSANSGLTISDATVFSSVAEITNYYAFNLVTGVPAAVVASEPHLDPDTLTDAQIVTFVQTYLQANISADGWNLTDGSFLGITTGTTVYSGGYTNNIMQYAVEEVPSLTFTHAFNTLTPSGAADISQITNVAEWRFQTYVIAVDTAARYGLRAESGVVGWILMHRDYQIYPNSDIAVNLGDESVLNGYTNYSRLKDYEDNINDMAENRIKTNLNGVPSYLFRRIGFNSSTWYNTPSNRNNPDSPSSRYQQWTQTSNPFQTKVSDGYPYRHVIGLGNLSGNTGGIAGLHFVQQTNTTLLNVGTDNTHWDGVHYARYWPSGYIYPGFANEGQKIETRGHELYVWAGPKPSVLP